MVTALQLLKKLQNLNFEQLEQKKGIGPILVSNLKEFISSDRYKNLVAGLNNLEKNKIIINLDEGLTNENSRLLNDDGSEISVVLTGSFENPRSVIAKKLEILGLKVNNSVNSSTNYLLCGEKPGSSLAKATKLNIAVYYEVDEFLNFISSKHNINYSTQPNNENFIEATKENLLF